MIVCSRGRDQDRAIREFQCVTAQYQDMWSLGLMEDGDSVLIYFDTDLSKEMQIEYQWAKEKAGGRKAIIEFEIEVTLALMSVLAAFSLMMNQCIQFSNAQREHTTVPPSRKTYGAVFLLTVLSGCLLLVPSVVFIHVNMTFRKASTTSSFDVSFPYSLVLSVLAAGLNVVAVPSVVCLTCSRRQEESSEDELSSDQGGFTDQHQQFPLMSQQMPHQDPNKQPPQTYMHPTEQYSSSGGFPDKSAINSEHNFPPRKLQGQNSPPRPEGTRNQPNTGQHGQDNVQYRPSDKCVPEQYHTNRPRDQSHWQQEDHSNVQVRSHERRRYENAPRNVQLGKEYVHYWPSDKYVPTQQYHTNRPLYQSHWQPEGHSNIQMRTHDRDTPPHFHSANNQHGWQPQLDGRENTPYNLHHERDHVHHGPSTEANKYSPTEQQSYRQNYPSPREADNRSNYSKAV